MNDTERPTPALVEKWLMQAQVGAHHRLRIHGRIITLAHALTETRARLADAVADAQTMMLRSADERAEVQRLTEGIKALAEEPVQQAEARVLVRELRALLAGGTR